MQYAIYDKVTREYLCEDGTWVLNKMKTDVVDVPRRIALFRDDDRAVAKIRELSQRMRADTTSHRVDFELQSFDAETCYVVRPVTDSQLLEKVRAANRAN